MALTIALAGNPNCGKTTLFNKLTGASQRVGNWPGVTIDKKVGKIRGTDGAELVDTPGIYSLSPYSPEEIVTRNFLMEGNPDAVINIVDA
ncbi:MAG: 50S ribosome-binding GTPase, partial [Candidatus Methanomethylophilaceae archaeon]|nr:50S ribosome-binding GTPase [Candidatus Methanomethylophilaceae archaeon]